MQGISKNFSKQECIPVGCVPSAAVAIGGGSARGCVRVCVCEGGVCPGGCVCPEQVCLPNKCTPPPPVDSIPDTRL